MKKPRRRNKLSEKRLIETFERMVSAGGKRFPGLAVGIGDDAAVIRPSAEQDLILTTDIQVEGVHFKRDWFTGRELGWRLAAVNLSDIAAMGGRPLYALLSIAFPLDLKPAYINEIEMGAKSHLGRYGAFIIGGNISKSKKQLVCDLTLAGACLKRKAWRRMCRPGLDAIVVAGALGSARAGLAMLESRSRHGLHPSLIRAFKKPRPLLEVVELLRGDPAVHGAIDVSDGFSTDLIHICEKSKAGCAVDPSLLPISPSLRRFCEKHGEDPINWALKGGEDYALILSVAGRKAEAIASRLAKKLRIPVRVVGRFTKRKGCYELLIGKGKRKQFSAEGWDHLAG